MTEERHDGGWRVDRRDRNGEAWLSAPPAPPPGEGGPGVDHRVAVVRAAVEAAAADGVTAVHWEGEDDDVDTFEEVARRAGLDRVRDILRLERSLPMPPEARAGLPTLAVRPLRPGTADEAAWVRCNNRTFADHPDQGRESVATLHAAMGRPWFDAAGFLLLDGDPPVDEGGDLDGFCWTKVHLARPGRPAAGEIYVIGVDPDAAGRRLGPALVLAGLDHMTSIGLTRALLYVDAENAPARRLYGRLGFEPAAIRRVRSRDVG